LQLLFGTVLLVAALVLTLAPAPASSAGLSFGQGVLWQLDRDGVPPSYVFGTIHVSDQRVIDLPDPVDAAFARSNSATFEIVLTAEHQVRFAQSMVLSDGRTLDAILGPELFQKAAAAAARYGLTADILKMFKPWALVPIFSYPPDQIAQITAGNLPLDQWLQSEADRLGKTVHALETFDEQLSLFNDMSEADQVDLVRALVDDKMSVEARFDQTLLLYLDRDISGIHAQMLEQTSAADQGLADVFQQDFIVTRNHRMVDRMGAQLSKGKAFIAVGALHLPGDEGILNLLQRDGYRITRLY
jgi:uncharacterized protein YbaP (TraB family)